MLLQDAGFKDALDQIQGGLISCVRTPGTLHSAYNSQCVEKAMIKLVSPMKRTPGMSVEAFRRYYESRHRLIGEMYLKGYARRYFRQFLDPLPDRDGVLRDPEYDVILHIWYPDQASFAACGKRLAEPAVAAEIREDEKKLFDTRYMRSYLVEEHESDFNS